MEDKKLKEDKHKKIREDIKKASENKNTSTAKEDSNLHVDKSSEKLPKVHWLTKLMQKPLFIFFALLFGAAGGVPSIFLIKDLFKKDIDFFFTPRTGVISLMPSVNKDKTTILMTGTFVNYGKDPLFVAGFDLNVKYAGKEIHATRMVVKDWNFISTPKLKVNIDSMKQYDMSQSKVIHVNEPITGSLLFEVDVPYEEINSVDERIYKLSCMDLKGEFHSREFTAYRQHYTGTSIYPETGVTIEKTE